MKKIISLLLATSMLLSCDKFNDVKDCNLSNAVSKGVIAYWSFDDGTAKDNSGNGFNGSFVGNLTVASGISGKALQFDGESFVSVVGDELGMTRQTVRTVSLWVNPSSIQGGGLISKYRHFEGVSNYYARLQLINGKIVTVLTGRGTDGLFVQAGQLNKWQHFVFIMEEGIDKSKIYLNGTLVGQGTLTYDDNISHEPLRIGNIVGADNQNFIGSIDEVIIYNRALNQEEIGNLFRFPKCQKIFLQIKNNH
jgi:hypothetical protein